MHTTDKKKSGNLKSSWTKLKSSPRFHSALMYLVFVFIAAVFWFIISLNDNVIETFKVRLSIVNVPDSVTFITDPPSEISVTLRDKGTNILRSGVVKKQVVDINFDDYAGDGILKLSRSDLQSELKSDFGDAAQIASVSIDSLVLYYSTEPGRRVPVVVHADVSAASGYIIAGAPVPQSKSVLVYSFRNEADTVNRVETQLLTKRNLSQTSMFKVKFKPISHVKIVPSSVDVKVPVEPLVHKESYATIEVEGVPGGESLLLFPNKVPVSYFVPMSKFGNADVIIAHVNYADTYNHTGSRLPVRLKVFPQYMVNVELKTDSVEYSVVKQ
ncbi:MAG: hypothetical protein NC204_03595 [Candidatus Amulumruptor caecigallinarius]|nr:hypothetical protein [Candidatus Amulumruptor caecigallinarius]